MCDEFALTSPVEGTSDFSAEFSAQGLRDSNDRSLRDLELQTRLFRYPCSYLIYSSSFDSLPDEVRLPTVASLREILAGDEQPKGEVESDKFAHLTPELRLEILEILRETKPGFE